MAYDWTKENIGSSIDADLCALWDLIEERGDLNVDGDKGFFGVNLYLGYADNCPTLRTAYAITASGGDIEICRDTDELEIVDVLPDEEIVVFQSLNDDDYEPFSVYFAEADEMASGKYID